jgi:copper(I)-binding protein
LVAALVACASKPSAGPQIRAEDVWSRPSVALAEMSDDASVDNTPMDRANTGTGAVYMRLVNAGREADRLVGGQTEIAQVLEIHETTLDGDVMKMQHLPDGLEIPAEAQVELKPGSYHIMLIGLQRDLKEGDTFPVLLELDKSGTLTVQVQVRQP